MLFALCSIHPTSGTCSNSTAHRPQSLKHSSREQFSTTAQGLFLFNLSFVLRFCLHFSEAYNLDPYLNPDAYVNDNLPCRSDTSDVHFEGGKLYEQLKSRNYQHSYQPSTSAHHHQVVPGTLTYQTYSNESAFVKACCRNKYTLASSNDQVPFHSGDTFEQHRQVYQEMALQPYPPLHYAYQCRPVPQPLPSMHTNLIYDQDYSQNLQNFQPMKRYNYLRPTPAELAALHNEEDESDEEFEVETNQVSEHVATTSSAEIDSCDDSIQIFEISSSSFNEDKVMQEDSSNDETAKPSNNKENTESAVKKKKAVVATASGRFYATRQTDRKMRSGNVRTIGKERLARRITKSIKKAVKTLVDPKAGGSSVKVQDDPLTMRGSRKVASRSNENKISEVETRKLRSAPAKKAARQTNFRSKQHPEPASKAATLRKRPAALLDNIERGRERRMK